LTFRFKRTNIVFAVKNHMIDCDVDKPFLP